MVCVHGDSGELGLPWALTSHCWVSRKPASSPHILFPDSHSRNSCPWDAMTAVLSHLGAERFRGRREPWPNPAVLNRGNSIALVHYRKDSTTWGLPRWLSGKESVCDAGDTGDPGSIPGWGRSSGGGNGNPLQYSCLGNPMDRGAWWAAVHGVRVGQDWATEHMFPRAQWSERPPDLTVDWNSVEGRGSRHSPTLNTRPSDLLSEPQFSHPWIGTSLADPYDAPSKEPGLHDTPQHCPPHSHLVPSQHPSTLSLASQKAFFCPWVRPCQHLTHVLRAARELEGAATINELMVGKHICGQTQCS